MPRTRIAAACLAALATAVATIGVAPSAQAATAYSFAVIGDVPYGSTQYTQLPSLIAQINADQSVQTTTHVGDISSPINCTDSYYAGVKSMFDAFAQPFIYTPGDNEWTDCHRSTVGGPMDPIARLAAVRSTFFPTPGTTLGKNPLTVTAQQDYPENVRYDQGDLTFATLNLPGSDNDLDSWSGLGYTSPTTAQLAEESARSAADVTWIDQAFSEAAANGSRAVVLETQADMFRPGTTTPSAQYKRAYGSVVTELAAKASAFAGAVFLMNGDTHVFHTDTPLTSSSWLSFYGIASPVPNLTRYTVQSGTSEYARFTETSDASVLQVQRVPYSATVGNQAPTARFTSTTADLGVNVDGTTSSDPDGTVASYAWTFGDGADGSGSTAAHTYATAGTYTVTLTVTDNAGGTASASHSVTVGGSAPTPTTLVTAGSGWSYLFPSGGAPAGWSGVSFDDSTWKSGAAPLGWGSSSIKTAIATASSSNPLTSYYRRSVTVSDPSTLGTVSFSTRADDGVVVYVNGVEVQRANMPTGTVTSGTYAKTAVTTSTAAATPVTFTVPSTAFRAGTNIIAAEVHSNYHATGNTSFDLAATASGAPSSGGTGGTGGTGGGSTGSPLPSGTTVLPAGSTWAFLHPTTAPASGWSASGFDTSSWTAGAAPLGWGSSGLATTIPLPSGTNPLASYFVSTFSIPSGGVPSTGLTLTTRADDGVIVFVNGKEVGRSNLPTGTIGQNTYATTARSTATAVASPVTFTVPASLLTEGTNTIAAEVQTNYHSAKDCSFDLSAVVQ